MIMQTISIPPGQYTRQTFDTALLNGLDQSRTNGAVIGVSTNGICLDLSGVVLDGEGAGGVGISVRDCEDVTVQNGVIKGFHYGIHAENVTRLFVNNCVVSDNANPIDSGWLPDTDSPIEEGFGGGIYLRRVTHSVIENNQVNNNFNGISLVRSGRNVIGGNHASYCGNVGIYLLMSSHIEVLHNLCEHCIRYTGRFWCDTADSAGIMLEWGSNHNRIIGNSLRYSGDGFFIRANPRANSPVSSDHNLVQGNDGSFSPNNAFEAVFSGHNIFRENVANYSNYGFWLGYSSDTTVQDNTINANRVDGIAIEHGRANTLRDNQIEGNRNGINLWGKPWQRPGTPPDQTPHSCTVSGNSVLNSRGQAIRVEPGLGITLEKNAFNENLTGG